MSRLLYPYYLSIEQKNLTLLWEQADAGDVFHIHPDGCLFVAKDKKDVKRKLGDVGVVQWQQSASLNMDEFWKKLATLSVAKSSSTRTCSVLHSGWNFFDDMLRTFSRRAALKKSKSPILESAYRKIFLGCNLKSVMARGESYHPQWKAKEIVAMREYFAAAWNVLEKRIQMQ